jgi:hypothetical protein
MVAPKDSRVDRALELIDEVFGDVRLSQGQTKELLKTIREDIDNRLKLLGGDGNKSADPRGIESSTGLP